MNNSARTWLLAMAGLALGCAACRPSGTPAPPGTPGVIFFDDFTQTTTGWDRHTGTDATTDYDNGQYLISVDEPGVNVWATPGLDLTDVLLEADTQYVAGPANNEYGLICRYTRAGDGKKSFYFFQISSDGYYALGKVSQDVRSILNPAVGSFQPAQSVQTGAVAVNHLAATCQGQHLSLSVNGTLVGEFTDDELTHGDVGLIAGTFDEPGVKIHFDQVSVRRPA